MSDLEETDPAKGQAAVESVQSALAEPSDYSWSDIFKDTNADGNQE